MFSFNHKTALTLAAAVVLASSALVSSNASADPGFGGDFKGGFYKPHFRPPFFHHRHRPYWGWGYGVRRHYWVAPVMTTRVATRHASTSSTNMASTTASATTANKTNCLTKEYTSQGMVLFKDTCTNEWAVNSTATTTTPATSTANQVSSASSSAPSPQHMIIPGQQPAPLPGLQSRAR